MHHSHRDSGGNDGDSSRGGDRSQPSPSQGRRDLGGSDGWLGIAPALAVLEQSLVEVVVVHDFSSSSPRSRPRASESVDFTVPLVHCMTSATLLTSKPTK